KPTVTAGFTWQPETGPSAYANASNTNPNANAVVTTPADVLAPVNLNPNDNVAAPTAKITSSAVPAASAANFRTDMTGPSPPTLVRPVAPKPCGCSRCSRRSAGPRATTRLRPTRRVVRAAGRVPASPDSRQLRAQRLALAGIVGPVAFGLTAVVGGAIESGY